MAATTIPGKHVDIRMWTRPETVEEQAMRQLHNIAALPWTFKHVAVMPDVHLVVIWTSRKQTRDKFRSHP